MDDEKSKKSDKILNGELRDFPDNQFRVYMEGHEEHSSLLQQKAKIELEQVDWSKYPTKEWLMDYGKDIVILSNLVTRLKILQYNAEKNHWIGYITMKEYVNQFPSYLLKMVKLFTQINGVEGHRIIELPDIGAYNMSSERDQLMNTLRSMCSYFSNSNEDEDEQNDH